MAIVKSDKRIFISRVKIAIYGLTIEAIDG
jgi:hypothetical protein